MAIIGGTSGADYRLGTTSGDTISGFAGNDTLNGNSASVPNQGTDFIDGGADLDTLEVTIGGDELGAVTVTQGASGWSVRSANNIYYVDSINMERLSFAGGAGDDYVDSGSGASIIRGGVGDDHWVSNYAATTIAVRFDLFADSDVNELGVSWVEQIERINMRTGSGADTILGGQQGDTISTGGGADRVNMRTRETFAFAPADIFDGGAGTDTLIVDASDEAASVNLGVGGSPTYSVRSTSGRYYVDAYAVEKVEFFGGQGDDTINTGRGGVKIDGRLGMDHWIADLSYVTTGIDYDLSTSSLAAAGITLISGVERISLTLGGGNDTITGGAQGDSVIAGGGGDIVDLATRPTFSGAPGDYVDGGAGTDTLVVNASAESDGVYLSVGGSPTYSVRSDSGRFYVDAYATEKVKFTGGSGDDVIDTGTGGFRVDGSGGIDHWIGNYGAVAQAINFTLGEVDGLAEVGLLSLARVERITLTTGGGNDVIRGGALGDLIRTGAGADTVDLKTRSNASGAAGDEWQAGDGTDTLIVDASAETQSVRLTIGGSPTHSVRSDSGRFYVDAYNVERVRFTGGAGDDFIQTGATAVTVDGNGGIDHWHANYGTATAAISFTLGVTASIASVGLQSITDVDRLTLTTGSGADLIRGGAQGDRIDTGAGDDTVDLKTRSNASGAAGDEWDGGAGTDTLVVDASAETQSVNLDAGGSPSFTVRSTSGNFFVDAYQVERVNFTGGSGADTIEVGFGGVSIDGGGGIDHLIWDVGGPQDVLFTLGATTNLSAVGGPSLIQRIERITLTTGAGDDTITGGAQGDTIRTGAGNDVINAKTRPAGSGPGDAVNGGDGVDTAVVDASAETDGVSVSAGTFSFFGRSDSGRLYLDAYEMEILRFTGGLGADSAVGGAGRDNLAGGGGGDVLRGGGEGDVLAGGAGRDTIEGGAGRDAIRIDTTLGSGNADTVVGFVAADDAFQLDDRVFSGLATGTLAAGAFRIGNAALDADDRIIYNKTAGALFFDADGNGSGGVVRFANVDPNTAIGAADFIVI